MLREVGQARVTRYMGTREAGLEEMATLFKECRSLGRRCEGGGRIRANSEQRWTHRG